MQRRLFICTAASGITALALPKWLIGQTCSLTTPDRYGYGPFYLENAPQRAKIASPSEPGQPLFISGTVKDCNGPVKGAILEVWQATDAGCYIHPSQPSCFDGGNPEASRLWGTLITDDEGRYSFDTILPGKYLNGTSYRPRHIHFRIRSPQAASNPADLVTQLYFEGDPDIPGDIAASDPGAAARIIPLAGGGTESLSGIFNITLPNESVGLRDSNLPNFDVSIFRKGDHLSLHLPPLPAGEPVEVQLRDVAGTLLVRSKHQTTPIELKTYLIPRLGCLAELSWNGRMGLRRERVWLRR